MSNDEKIRIITRHLVIKLRAKREATTDLAVHMLNLDINLLKGRIGQLKMESQNDLV